MEGPVKFSARQLKSARALLGWTAEDLAARTGFHPVTIRKLESNGSGSNHTYKTIREVIQKAGIELDDIPSAGGVLREPVIEQPTAMPLIKLPLFQFYKNSGLVYGLIPEIICIQGNWIKTEISKISLPSNIATFLASSENTRTSSLSLAGNDRGYLALYSARAIIEKIAIGWIAHSGSKIDNEYILKLGSDNLKTRQRATQQILEHAIEFDPSIQELYDLISRYFAHASLIDLVQLDGTTEFDTKLRARAKVIPLLVLFDLGQKLCNLIMGLAQDQGIDMKLPTGGRKGYFSYNLESYIRLTAYVACERHSKKKGLPVRILLKNIKEIEGEVGLTQIFRGGMQVIRYGSTDTIPPHSEIADFAWYAVGREHDDKIKVKLEKDFGNRQVYELSWPKSLELDSSSIAFIASHQKGVPKFFDYVGEFHKAIEMFKSKVAKA